MKLRTQKNFNTRTRETVYGVSIMVDGSCMYCKYPIGYQEFKTNKDAKEIKVYNYDNIEITKGECLGYFKMGSTVVMIWEKDSVQIDNLLNQNVKFGQRIGKL